MYLSAFISIGTIWILPWRTPVCDTMASAQARNATHSEKKLADDGLAAFVKRFDIPVPEEAAKAGAAT